MLGVGGRNYKRFMGFQASLKYMINDDDGLRVV